MWIKFFKRLEYTLAGVVAFYLFFFPPFFALLDWLTGADFEPFQNDAMNGRLFIIVLIVSAFIFFTKKEI
jgi:hypothetical protein